MEKICTFEPDYTRKEASAAGFCSDCQNTNCPYNTAKGKDKSSRQSSDDFSLMDRENRNKRNKERDSKRNKTTFKRHSDNDDW